MNLLAVLALLGDASITLDKDTLEIVALVFIIVCAIIWIVRGGLRRG